MVKILHKKKKRGTQLKPEKGCAKQERSWEFGVTAHKLHSENEEGGLKPGGGGGRLRRRAARFYLQFCEVGGPVIIHNRT
jgi:hypothetical protein